MTNHNIRLIFTLVLSAFISSCESQSLNYRENPTCNQLNTINFENYIIVFADQTEKFKKEFTEMEKFLNQVKKEKNFIFIDYDKCPIYKELTERYNIEYLPTIVETDKRGNEVYRAFGMPNSKSFFNDIFEKEDDSTRDFAAFYIQKNQNIDEKTMALIDSGYWIINGELEILNKKLSNEYYTYLSDFPGWSTGKTKSGKNYEIKRNSNFSVNLKWGTNNDDFTFNDWYVNSNNQMIFSEVDIIEEGGTINPIVKVDTLDFNMENKDEFMLKRGEAILTFKRDITKQWKSY